MELQVPESSDVYELVDVPEPAPTVSPQPLPIPAVGVVTAPPAEAGSSPAQAQEKMEKKKKEKGKSKKKDKAEGGEGAEAAARRAKRRKQGKTRWDLPAWGVSVLVHVGVLGFMAALTLTPDVRKKIIDLNTALVDSKVSGAQSEPEPMPILADPANMPREEAVGSSMPTISQGIGTGTGPPSATPAIGVGAGTAVGAVSEKSSLPGVKVVAQVSGLSLLPSAPARDLGGGGMIAGDVTYETSDVGAALDQLAREILRHLEAHKLTVVWLFDESGSMKDDQKAVRDKFGRVASELKLNLDDDKKSAGALNHAIVGFGQDIHFELEKPTFDIDVIGKAIDRLRVDESGTENTLHAVQEVIAHYGRLISKERRLLIVLVTDESGDDGSYVEEARQLAVSRGVPIYIIGRQSLFGYERAHLLYIDPVTKDHYWPQIRRGPETAGVECLQWDGLHERWDEQPSGFAPYELARITKDTGGIYFLLPSEENMRVRQREKAYSITTLKEYVPDYESRIAYIERRQKSDLRRTLFDIIQNVNPSNGPYKEAFAVRRGFPVNPPELGEAALGAIQTATLRLAALNEVEKQLRQLQKLREREPERRWQANYDLMLAQVVTYQIKTYEYRALLQNVVKSIQSGKPPMPKRQPGPDLMITWEVNHSPGRLAPKDITEKTYVEAERLLKLVIERHPKTPWADLAQDEMNRGFSVRLDEWDRSPRYNERQKLVPKY
ncbi:MAG TPA: vWA domain-containing protein [Isosphaeraceae bacterium]|jgi:hypothetical protein|nr:vWA domain-containing protein [Isosphaeraceae bacterium]